MFLYFSYYCAKGCLFKCCEKCLLGLGQICLMTLVGLKSQKKTYKRKLTIIYLDFSHRCYLFIFFICLNANIAGHKIMSCQKKLFSIQKCFSFMLTHLFSMYPCSTLWKHRKTLQFFDVLR